MLCRHMIYCSRYGNDVKLFRGGCFFVLRYSQTGQPLEIFGKIAGVIVAYNLSDLVNVHFRMFLQYICRPL